MRIPIPFSVSSMYQKHLDHNQRHSPSVVAITAWPFAQPYPNSTTAFHQDPPSSGAYHRTVQRSPTSATPTPRDPVAKSMDVSTGGILLPRSSQCYQPSTRGRERSRPFNLQETVQRSTCRPSVAVYGHSPYSPPMVVDPAWRIGELLRSWSPLS